MTVPPPTFTPPSQSVPIPITNTTNWRQEIETTAKADLLRIETKLKRMYGTITGGLLIAMVALIMACVALVRSCK
jgi:hypothetical protein